MTSYTAAVAAVLAAVQAEWTATPVIAEGTTIYERPSPPAAFLTVEFDQGSGKPQWIASASYRHTGSVTLSAFVPEEDGAGMAYQMIEQAAGMLAQRSFLGGDVRTWAPSFGKLQPASGDVGWLAVEVALPLTVDADYAAA